MLFNYSTRDKVVTNEFNIIPSKDSIILDLTNEYYIFRKMYKNYLKKFYNLTIEEEVFKKAFIELIKLIKESSSITISLNDCESILTDIFYSNTTYEDIVFEYEDTLYVELSKFLEEFNIVYNEYSFIDYIVYTYKIKVLCTKEM